MDKSILFMGFLMVSILTIFLKLFPAIRTRKTISCVVFYLLTFGFKFLVTNITPKIPSNIEQGVCSNYGVQQFRLNTCTRLPRFFLKIRIGATKYI